jgi:Mrp family chromosome partitioning ATPase
MIHRTIVQPARQTRVTPALSASPEYYALMRNLAGQTDSPVIRSLGVTSSRSGEGVSTIALQCAIAAEQLFRQPVLLVEANTSKPSLCRKLQLERGPGFGDLLLDADTRDASLQRYADNLFVIASGNADARSLKRCSSQAIERTVESLHEGHRLTIWDLPAVSEDELSLELASRLDGVLLVVESEGVLADVAQEAVHRLRSCGTNVLGAVLNKQRQHVPRWLASKI